MRPVFLFVSTLCLGLLACGGDRPEESGSAPGEPRIPVPERILVIGIDTLRADHLQPYGYPRDTAPHLARLAAEEAVLFENAYAASSWTLPSMASVFTSLHPIQHGVVDRGHRLGEVPTLADELSDSGWTAAAMVTHVYVSSLFGLDRGFDEFHEISVARDFSEHRQIRADVLEREARRWIDEHAEDRFFLYLHFFDPHWNYDAPQPFTERFADPAYDGPASGRWSYLENFVATSWMMPPQMPPADLQHVKDLYDGEIYFTDHVLGRLFEGLRERKLWKDTLVIVLSDHGEEFQEHGSLHHIRTLFEEVLRVPLLIKPPGGRRDWMRQRVDERVSHVDLAPTILELAGREPPPAFEGRSLLPLIERPGDDRPIFAHTQRHHSDKVALRVGDEKIIRQTLEGREGVALYDLADDPGETRNLALERRDRTAELLEELDAEIRGMLERRAPAPENAPELGEEIEEELRALGYVE